MTEASRSLDRVAELFVRAGNVLFVTGAGMSADSGLPTYRGIGGLYERETTEEGVAIEDALSGAMLRENPALSWKYIRQIEAACRGARFHRGHEILAAFERHLPRVVVLTQNVDGFHADAGSKRVIEIHGNIHRLKCTRCRWHASVESHAELEIPPKCPDCGKLVRPDVVLFGERLPDRELDELDRELTQGFDLVVVIGTTAVFPYIAAPVLMAAHAGIPSVEINPGRSSVSDLVEHKLALGAKAALEALWERLPFGER